MQRIKCIAGALLVLTTACAEQPSNLVPSVDPGTILVDPGNNVTDLAPSDPGILGDGVLSDTAPPDTATVPDTAVPDVPTPPSPCASNPAACPCIDGECGLYDSDDLCQPRHSCVVGQCVPDESTVPVCTDPNPNDCATVVCHSGFGICVN